MRCYQFDANGKCIADYAVPQEGIETQLLPERPSEHHDEWDGNGWVLNQASLDAENAYNQKHTDAEEQLTLNDLAGKDYTQLETYVDNNIVNTDPSQIAYDKRIGKIVLAILKRLNLSD